MFKGKYEAKLECKISGRMGVLNKKNLLWGIWVFSWRTHFVTKLFISPFVTSGGDLLYCVQHFSKWQKTKVWKCKFIKHLLQCDNFGVVRICPLFKRPSLLNHLPSPWMEVIFMRRWCLDLAYCQQVLQIQEVITCNIFHSIKKWMN